MPHILVVDDEEDIREILRFNLESEGFKVTTASNAEEALHLIATGCNADLLLLDVMMEQMSGYDMVRQMRARGIDTPVIFLTARDTHDDQLQGFATGADDYITKPFAFDTVLARIGAVLRRCNGNNTTAAAALPNTQGLTRREYLILELLHQHRGNYLTRQEILQAVWPGNTLVGERSVDVHIARLRKKLGTEGNHIVNKTGFGYAMV